VPPPPSAAPGGGSQQTVKDILDQLVAIPLRRVTVILDRLVANKQAVEDLDQR
jgi:hypothetical protein